MLRELFIDESSQTQHRYLLLGGVLAKVAEAEVTAALNAARAPDLPAGEIGWVKVSQSKLEGYRRFVNVFFQGALASQLEFHCLVIDTSRLDHRTYNGGSRDAGFNKEIYQLLLKFARLHGTCEFHAYLDERSAPGKLSDLRDIVNRGMMLLTPQRDWPLRRLHFRNSAGCQTLQLVDIFLGAIGFHLNEHRRKQNASPAKCELSDYILASARIYDPFRDTSISGKFTVWHRQLRKPAYRR